MSDNLRYHRHLSGIAQGDLDYVKKKDAQYDASWKKRGGPGAWFTIVRPMDRLVNFVEENGKLRFDLFARIRNEGLAGPDGSIIACVRDLRRYLLLVEAEMTERLAGVSVVSTGANEDLTITSSRIDRPGVQRIVIGPGTPEDGGHHARQPDATESENSVADDILPMILDYSTFMRMSYMKQQLYTPIGRGYRLDESPDTSFVTAQLPGTRARYIQSDGIALLDRRLYPAADDYLLRLPHEVNDVEFGLLMHCHRILYDPPQGSDGKRVMRPEYRAAWSRL